jgi:tRNA(fMet)-specific endonuclease VapC
MYLLDTNICIYIIKKKPESVILKLINKINKGVFISSVSVAELQYGVEKSNYPQRNRIALLEFLSPFTILDFNINDAVVYGKIRSELEKTGKVIGSMDMLIGAQAQSRNLLLVTNNEKEFKRIDGLKIENWVV